MPILGQPRPRLTRDQKDYIYLLEAQDIKLRLRSLLPLAQIRKIQRLRLRATFVLLSCYFRASTLIPSLHYFTRLSPYSFYIFILYTCMLEEKRENRKGGGEGFFEKSLNFSGQKNFWFFFKKWKNIFGFWEYFFEIKIWKKSWTPKIPRTSWHPQARTVISEIPSCRWSFLPQKNHLVYQRRDWYCR